MNEDFTCIADALSENEISFLIDEPLCNHTTFRIGGNASLFISPATEDELVYALRILKTNEIRTFILGKGSNVLFDDHGFRGAVVSTAGLNEISICGDLVTAACGASFTYLSSFCADNSLAGLEFAYGIPGSVGGAVYMNAGAYGGEVADVVISSRYLDLSDFSVKEIFGEDHEFGYRHSVFRTRNWIHISSVFKLTPGNRAEIKAQMAELMQRRKDKQPLEYPSAGSTFKRYPGRYTGQMIEEAGLKGYRIGGAAVSEKHAGFVINAGGATSADVLELISHIKKRIKEQFDIEIECEVIYVNSNE